MSHNPKSNSDTDPEQVNQYSFLDEYSSRWTESEQAAHARILKLGILRDIHRRLHKERSKLLAEGRSDVARSLTQVEASLYDLDLAALDHFGLQKLLSQTAILSDQRGSPKFPELPEQVFEFLSKDKILRRDRIWDAWMLYCAHEMGWSLWTAHIWNKISTAENFHYQICDRLFPKAIGLLVESDIQKFSEIGSHGDLWCGIWYVLSPDASRPPSLDVTQIEGYSAEPEPMSWKLALDFTQLNGEK